MTPLFLGSLPLAGDYSRTVHGPWYDPRNVRIRVVIVCWWIGNRDKMSLWFLSLVQTLSRGSSSRKGLDGHGEPLRPLTRPSYHLTLSFLPSTGTGKTHSRSSLGPEPTPHLDSRKRFTLRGHPRRHRWDSTQMDRRKVRWRSLTNPGFSDSVLSRSFVDSPFKVPVISFM